MNSKIGLLSGVLIVQLVLVAVAFVGLGRNGDATPFLTVDVEAVSGLVIGDGDGNTVSLMRGADGWQIGELPADIDKITDVVEKLTGGNASWPVATSEDSRARFEVTEESHQRRIDLLADGESLASIYLGTSPGYRRVHARQEGEDAVYSIDFAVHEVPTEADQWLDKRLLATGTPVRIELPGGHVLARAGEEGGWTLDGAPADPEAAERYVERFERLAVLGLSEPDGETTLGDARTLTVEDGSGTRQLTFRFDEAADEYVLTSDRYQEAFTVAGYVAEQILADPSELLPDTEAAGEAGADETAGTPGAEAAGVDSPDDTRVAEPAAESP